MMDGGSGATRVRNEKRDGSSIEGSEEATTVVSNTTRYLGIVP